MKIVVTNLQKKFDSLRKPIERATRKTFLYLKKYEVSVEINLVGDKQMSKNVLAFPATSGFPRPDMPPRFLGEVYLNPSYISRHQESLLHMLIHGLLHLLGYDHMRKGDRIKMEKKEVELIARLTNEL